MATYTYTSIDGQRVQVDVASAYNNLNAAFRAAFGLVLHVKSGTRTYDEQRAIFLSRYTPRTSDNGPYNDVRYYQGVRYVRISSAGTVAVPGTSNHEEDGPIGPRALDIYDSGSNAGVTSAGNARSNWIRSNASKYGFNPAGYNFGEPWHIEFTGNFGGGSVAGGETGGDIYAQWGGATYVKSIQTKLNRLAYNLVVDGDPGPATRAAITDFQGKHGLTTDGVAGPLTNAKLDEVLNSSGTGPIAVDGQWGEATTRKLQSVLGVTVDGQMGPETIKALQGRLGVTQDGQMGPDTARALQKTLGVTADGAIGPQTVTALQNYLNAGGNFLNAPSQPPVTEEKIVVDGQWGAATTTALQKNLGVSPVDGQYGPQTIKALQIAMGQVADGVQGPTTIKALQMNVGATVDGSLGPETVKALQTFLNDGKIFHPVTVAPSAPVVTYPKPEAPTYPGANYWNHSPNSNSRNGTKITHFYIHHAADTSSVQTQINRFMDPNNDRHVSPTWFVGQDGSINEMVPPDEWAPWTTPSNNMYSVSVETGNTSGSPTWGISEESHVAIAKLVAWAANRYGFPIDRDHVKGHREAPNVPATSCPGPSMDLDKIVSYALKFASDVPPVVTPPVDPPVDPQPPVVVPPVEDTITITLSKSEATALKTGINETVGLLTQLDSLLP